MPPYIISGVWEVGKVLVLGGSRGAGKTAFETWMRASVMKAEPFLGRETFAPDWWGIIIIDRDSDTHRHWWKAAGIEPPPYYCLAEDPTYDDEFLIRASTHDFKDPAKLFRFLDCCIDKLNPPPGGALTIDVANPFTGSALADYMVSFSRGVALSRLAKRRQLGLLLIMHGGKQKRQDTYARLTDRIISNTGFLGAVHTVSYITTFEESVRPGLQEFVWEPHEGPGELFALHRLRDSGLFEVVDSRYIMDKVEQVKGAQSQPETIEDEIPYGCNLILSWIPVDSEGVFITTEIIKQRMEQSQLGLGARTVERYLAVMEDKGLIFRYKEQRGKWQRKAEA
jgi:hypothetical protein